MPISKNVRQLLEQVNQGPMTVPDFENSPELRFLKEKKLVILERHPVQPSPATQAKLTPAGMTFLKILEGESENKNLLEWMKSQNIENPLTVLKELKVLNLIEVIHNNGIVYKVL